MSDLALLFPGQGSQFVGMGKDLAESFPEARAAFEEADDVLGTALSRLAWEGPAEELTLTRNAQPALLVHSIAAFRVLTARLGPVMAAAGHSLGEFSAHVAAGTFSFADGVAAVRQRGELMFAAGEARPGSMSAVLGLSDEDVSAGCAEASTEDSVVVPANYNTPGQVVISGDLDALDRASEVLRESGAKRVVPLTVSGAFHSPLMEPAREGLAAVLDGMTFQDSAFPVISNVTAGPIESPEAARRLLVEQLTSPVRWSGSVSTMVEKGATRFLELGPGSVLAGLNRRNAKGLTTLSIGDVDSVQGFPAGGAIGAGGVG